MKKIVFSLLTCALVLSACGTTLASKITETATLTPLPSSTAIPTMRSTETPVPTLTATFTPTSEKMTLEEWHKIFSGSIIPQNGQGNYKLYGIWDRNDIVTSPEQISGTELAILNPSGEIVIGARKEDAIDALKKGAIILKSNNSHPFTLNTDASLAMQAAFRAYQEGNHHIYMRFGEYDVSLMTGALLSYSIDEIPQLRDVDGRITSPVVRLPTAMFVTKGKKNYRPSDLGINDDLYWLDQMLKAGVDDWIGICASQANVDWVLGLQK